MALPANITTGSDNNVLSIAASNNKGLLIRFLNEQVEDGFYTLVIDYLKDNNFDLKTMKVDDDVKAQCEKLYELGEFVDENIKAKERYEIDEWIEPLFNFVYGDIDPSDIDAPINTTGIYRFSIWLFRIRLIRIFYTIRWMESVVKRFWREMLQLRRCRKRLQPSSGIQSARWRIW